MGITKSFDKTTYGQVSVDPATSVFSIGDQQVELTRTQAGIIACFINLGEERASLKTMTELVGTSEAAFKAMLSYARKKISAIEIAEGVTADALFLSDRLMGKSDSEKLPYHFNTRLADIINNHGLNCDPTLIADVRTKPKVIVGVSRDTGAFHQGLGS